MAISLIIIIIKKEEERRKKKEERRKKKEERRKKKRKKKGERRRKLSWVVGVLFQDMTFYMLYLYSPILNEGINTSGTWYNTSYRKIIGEVLGRV